LKNVFRLELIQKKNVFLNSGILNYLKLLFKLFFELSMLLALE